MIVIAIGFCAEEGKIWAPLHTWENIAMGTEPECSEWKSQFIWI
jgi:hypothetical protein